ncbi:YesL family protein [Robertmurraya sp. P23]|uniref:YesL family protein n=1 Tax=Robertmurraya sp. P23 TaxID=3436931 RepID=UPI003D954882
MLKSVEKVNHIFNTILNLVYLNILWSVYTLLGLIIFGIGPSTYALVSICRQWIRGNQNIPVFKSYWKYYKECFKDSVVISWVYLLAGFVLVVDLQYVTNWYARVALFVISFMYLLSLVYIFPIMAHYSWKGILLKIKMSFLFGLACMQYSLVLGVVIVVIYGAATNFFPGILTFFGISFLFYLITWTSNQVFTRMESVNGKELEGNISNQIAKENRDEKKQGIKVS